MTGPNESKNDSISKVYALINAGAEEKTRLMIVNTTVLDRLLSIVPPETLTSFIQAELTTAPSPESPQFKVWLKDSRSLTALSQRDFAERLRQLTGLKIHGSDIGNLETGTRKIDYGIDRLLSIQAAVKYAVPLILSNKTEASL